MEIRVLAILNLGTKKIISKSPWIHMTTIINMKCIRNVLAHNLHKGHILVEKYLLWENVGLN